MHELPDPATGVSPASATTPGAPAAAVPAVPAVRQERGRLSTSADLEQAFGEHASAVGRALRRVESDRETVADLVQETFLRAWRQRDAFDPARSPLRAWLLMIARGVSVDHLRSQRVRPWHRLLRVPRHDDGAGSETDASESVLAAWIVEEEVRRLPLPLRQVVVETQLRDRPHADVAADLGIPVGTVRSRLFHALRSMRASLEAQGFVP